LWIYFSKIHALFGLQEKILAFFFSRARTRNPASLVIKSLEKNIAKNDAQKYCAGKYPIIALSSQFCPNRRIIFLVSFFKPFFNNEQWLGMASSTVAIPIYLLLTKKYSVCFCLDCHVEDAIQHWMMFQHHFYVLSS
jgi:hypothetical protein